MVLSIQSPIDLGDEDGINRSNQLLNLLPESKLRNLLAHSERITLPAKTSLYRLDEPIKHVYFPLYGVVSLLNVSAAGLVVELASVSDEGMVGVSTFLGDNVARDLAIAQTNLVAIRMPVELVRREFERGEELQQVLLLYTQTLLDLISQNVFCSCHHTLEQRLARWLLYYSDRLEKKRFRLTQETLAELLGVRRSSLSAVAVDLRQRNLIHYSRGKITILNSEALRQLSCGCELKSASGSISPF